MLETGRGVVHKTNNLPCRAEACAAIDMADCMHAYNRETRGLPPQLFLITESMERAREINAMPLAQMRDLPTQELIQAYRLMRVHDGVPAAANLRLALYAAVGYRRFR
jgi:hypothetical protein